ncbi:MAG: gamma carbonic anhydrase family protein [Clostridia bacterium]|nr:gamma carbonic anhydrase family protein [Clostridia bacterium]
MPVYPYEGVTPQMEEDVLLAPGAMVVGRVKIGRGSSVWYNAVIRGDVHDVVIGQYSSIQDGTLIHEDSGRGSGLEGGLPTVVGNYVTVGHGVILHACRVEDYALIGMGSIIMDGAVVGKGAVIGAGALVTKNTVIPPFSVAVGSPAKVLKTLPESSLAQRKEQAMHYYGLAVDHRRMLDSLQD